MTFSRELLPAPFGPMIARISPVSTAKSTSATAVTPPNDKEIDSSFRFWEGTGIERCAPLFVDRSKIDRGAAVAFTLNIQSTVLEAVRTGFMPPFRKVTETRHNTLILND